MELSQGLSKPAIPASFSKAGVWRLGLSLVRLLPKLVLQRLCLACAEIYYCCFRRQREIVVQNLLPVLSGDRHAAESTARKLFRQFALKLVDLWRYEAGGLVENWNLDPEGWERFRAWQASGRGILLVMPHLGNWELGAPLLAGRGIKLTVITQAEPDDALTEMRKASRAKWGVETVVIGNGSFAFLDVIRRLQDGATVALLIDRPAAPTAVRVELFGRPFLASVAAAELARATGCVLSRVSVLRTGETYSARLYPEIEYDRQELGNRDARRQLTERIMRSFEPEIRDHLDQWYHFGPLWPAAS